MSERGSHAHHHHLFKGERMKERKKKERATIRRQKSVDFINKRKFFFLLFCFASCKHEIKDKSKLNTDVKCTSNFVIIIPKVSMYNIKQINELTYCNLKNNVY